MPTAVSLAVLVMLLATVLLCAVAVVSAVLRARKGAAEAAWPSS
jgi:hypothetical protein